MRAFFKYLGGLALILIIIVLVTNFWIVMNSSDRVYSDADILPDGEVAIVLGTSKRLIGGEDNPFFHNRIASAAELYNRGKVKHLLLSGDSTSRYYNEPVDMKKALVDLGIPENAIILDNEGLRTFDSIRRCREVFGYDTIIIVTQRFHSYRALYISQYFDLDAHAYVTASLPIRESFRVVIREYFARTKAILDLYVL